MSTPRPPFSGPQSAAGAAASPLTTKQRIRVRKLVRRGLIGVVAVQMLVVFAITTPTADAWGIVFDPRALVQAIKEYAMSRARNTLLDQTKGLTNNINDLAERNNVKLGALGGNANTFDANDVSTTVVEDAFNRHQITGGGEVAVGNRRIHHLGYTSYQSVQAMQDLMPGVKAWDNYQEDYLASADGALTTMRASMDALNQFHQHMAQDDRRFTRLLDRANGLNSELAVGQIQVESNLEVARQLQALRAQQALQTNIYAVTESHRVSSDARSMAKAKRNNCQMLAMFGGGLLGGLAGDVAGTLASQTCN